MSARPQRGRTVQPRRQGNLRTLYLVIGVIALVAIVGVAVAALQGGQRTSQTTVPTGVPPARQPVNAQLGKTDEGLFFKGDPNAPVVVTEFADFQCPGCAYYTTAVEAQFDAQYVETGRVKFVYHDFPLNMHPNAIPAAEAARCAGDQGAQAFWQMHDLLFANQRQWGSLPDPTAQFGAYAAQLGLDTGAFTSCMTSHTHRGTVTQSQQAANQLGLSGTPSFAVNGQVVDTRDLGSVDQIVARMREQVDAALAAQ